jgi:hypothetical protein
MACCSFSFIPFANSFKNALILYVCLFVLYDICRHINHGNTVDDDDDDDDDEVS